MVTLQTKITPESKNMPTPRAKLYHHPITDHVRGIWVRKDAAFSVDFGMPFHFLTDYIRTTTCHIHINIHLLTGHI